MIRSFLAIPLPEDAIDALSDLQDHVRNARWVDAENLHLTLIFLGDCDRRELADLDTALATMRGECFTLSLDGVGAFGGEKPHLLYAALAESEPLRRLQSKIERRALDAGIAVERRKYRPHVTLARCGGGVIPAQALQWTVTHARFSHPAFEVREYALYRSDLGKGVPVYTELMRYPLGAPG